MKLRIRREILDRWQGKWEVDTKGRPVAEFISDVRERMKGKFWSFDHYISQVVTEHGAGRSYLSRIGKEGNCRCICGGVDTIRHKVLECVCG